MTRRSHLPILLVCAAVGVACGRDEGLEPASELTGLRVTPTKFALATAAPGNALQLRISAWDQAGLTLDAGAATYSSSALAIAGVSSSGIVTAAAPGTAEITAALTFGGKTRTASMTVTVYALDYSDIAGVYDLRALITSFDPAWGEDLTGYLYTAVLTLHEERGPPWFGGTWADGQLIGPAGDSYDLGTGFVTGSLNLGLVVIEVRNDHWSGLSLIVGTLASGFIDGSFGCCGHIGGTFTAERR